METVSDEASGGLAIADDTEEDFESVHDVRFITVNRIGAQYEAEVILSGDSVVDEARIQEALDVASSRGVHAYARKHGLDSVLIFFTADTADGE
jgi:hypothetical protein